MLFAVTTIMSYDCKNCCTAWQQPHTMERHVVKTGGAGGVPTIDFGFNLPHDINAYAFSKFADIYAKVGPIRTCTINIAS